jgi:TetR/AcrR family transcriptional repressor of nem operon
MRYEPDHKQKTRAKLLRETAKALRREGPHRLGVARVMAAAGLTVGGFYAHFKSKDDLVAEGIGQLFAEAATRLPAELDGAAPAQWLAGYIDFYLSAAHRDARTSGCPLPFLNADAPRLGSESRRRFAEGVEGMRERLASRLTALGRPEPYAEATSLLSELVGALALARAEPDRAASDRILAASRGHLFRRFQLESL